MPPLSAASWRRLWAGNADPESWEFQSQALSLLTPLRTLRGHQEALTSLQLLTSTSGERALWIGWLRNPPHLPIWRIWQCRACPVTGARGRAGPPWAPAQPFLAPLPPAPCPAAGVTIAATGSKDRTVRLWGLAPLVPSPVQKPGIATLRGHGAPVTCLAVAGGSMDGSECAGSSSSGSGGSGAGSGWLLSGSLDGRVKLWDPFHGTCVGTAKCAVPIAACQAAAAAPELQPHTLLVSGGTQVQLLDTRCMRPVAGVALPAERAEAVHCFSQWGWDLAVGASDGARVFDMRQLPSLAGSGAAAGGAAAAAGRAAPERLRLTGHARPVSGSCASGDAAQCVAVCSGEWTRLRTARASLSCRLPCVRCCLRCMALPATLPAPGRCR